jgi:3',5'-cyclic AMP phosphodiesterase CpdA
MHPFRSLSAFALFVVLTFSAAAQAAPFTFVQLSDTHWGFNNAKINPDYAGTFLKGIAEVNALKTKPDFLVFTGDETHTTGEAALRQKRMAEFQAMAATLSVKTIHYLPGEHDVGPDQGAAYKQFFGDLHYTFDYQGVHFVALDNVSNPDGSLGDEQLTWLAGLLQGWDKTSQIILFAHRPLIDVYAPWDWRTKDGAKAVALLQPFPNSTLFYGHIHQKRIDAQAGFTQFAAQGMMFPLPPPGTLATASQVPWDAKRPYRGLGFRVVTVDPAAKKVKVTEYAIVTDPLMATDDEEIED